MSRRALAAAALLGAFVGAVRRPSPPPEAEALLGLQAEAAAPSPPGNTSLPATQASATLKNSSVIPSMLRLNSKRSLPDWWTEEERATAAAMIGYWQDSKNRGYVVNVFGEEALGFFDLPGRQFAKLQPSVAVAFFEGDIEDQVLRFGFRRAKEKPQGELIVERQVVDKGGNIQWVRVGGDKFDRHRMTTADVGQNELSATLTGAEKALASNLLGTWVRRKAPFQREWSWSCFGKRAAPCTFTFHVDQYGMLTVAAEGTEVYPLTPSGMLFTGILGEGKATKTMMRVRCAANCQYLLGERPRRTTRVPTWKTIFFLRRLSGNLTKLEQKTAVATFGDWVLVGKGGDANAEASHEDVVRDEANASVEDAEAQLAEPKDNGALRSQLSALAASLAAAAVGRGLAP